MLQDAKIDTFVHVHAFSGSIAASNPHTSEIISLIENEAKGLFRKLDTLTSNNKLDHLDLMRFSCLSAITGANGIVNLTQERWLHTLNPVYYFPLMSVKAETAQIGEEADKRRETRRKIPPYKPKYKIAYQILTHEIDSFVNIELLVDKLDTIDSIILIHVDLKSAELRMKVEELIEQRKYNGLRNNVFLQKVSYGVIWGI
jgi:hypothetical protein